LADDELSIGDYVLTNGALPAMVVIDAVVRLVPGVLGDERSPWDDSFSGQDRLLEFAQYTRPREFRGLGIPEVLLGGNHEQIARWRREQSLQATSERRSELLPRLETKPPNQ
jgi:tRNA (guanine37-N1)-methyltransferase